MEQRIKKLLSNSLSSASKFSHGVTMIVVALFLAVEGVKTVALTYDKKYIFDLSIVEEKWIALVFMIWTFDLILRPLVKRSFNAAFRAFGEAFEILERMSRNNEKYKQLDSTNMFKNNEKDDFEGNVVHERDAAIKSQ